MVKVGDKLQTKKKHPCGGDEFIVVREGADYKIKCEKCGRVVMCTPDQLKKMIKNIKA